MNNEEEIKDLNDRLDSLEKWSETVRAGINRNLEMMNELCRKGFLGKEQIRALFPNGPQQPQ